MDPNLIDVFEQARKLVSEADRKVAEEQERRKQTERETRLRQLATRMDDAFDFTSKEKLELDPRLDVDEHGAVVEFLVRSMRALFTLTPQDDGVWALQVVEDSRKPQALGGFSGGSKADHATRRLAAARIVTAIGNWVQNVKSTQLVVAPNQAPRWNEEHEEKHEPTYGTMGKFLGY